MMEHRPAQVKGFTLWLQSQRQRLPLFHWNMGLSYVKDCRRDHIGLVVADTGCQVAYIVAVQCQLQWACHWLICEEVFPTADTLKAIIAFRKAGAGKSSTWLSSATLSAASWCSFGRSLSLLQHQNCLQTDAAWVLGEPYEWRCCKFGFGRFRK